MSYSRDQLEAFVAAAEHGSFTGAARALGKAQSSVSGLIANLEIDAGLDLFDRSTRNPQLTAAGRALLRDARAVLGLLREFDARCRSLAGGAEAHVSLALDAGLVDPARLQAVFADFQAAWPDVSLLVHSVAWRGPAELVRAGQAHIGLLCSTDDYPEEFGFRGIGAVEFVAVAAAGHPLAELDAVTPEDLARHCHLRASSPEAGLRISDSDISRRSWYASDQRMLLELLRAGRGWAQVPARLADESVADGSLVRLRTTYQLRPWTDNVDLIWSRSRPPGIAGQWLLEQLSLTL